MSNICELILAADAEGSVCTRRGEMRRESDKPVADWDRTRARRTRAACRATSGLAGQGTRKRRRVFAAVRNSATKPVTRRRKNGHRYRALPEFAYGLV